MCDCELRVSRDGSVGGAGSARSGAGAAARGLEAIVRRRRDPSSGEEAGAAAGLRLGPGLRESSERPAPKSFISWVRSRSKDCNLSLTGPSPEVGLVRRVGRFEELGRSVGMKDSQKTHSAGQSDLRPRQCRFDNRAQRAFPLRQVDQHQTKQTHHSVVRNRVEERNRSTDRQQNTHIQDMPAQAAQGHPTIRKIVGLLASHVVRLLARANLSQRRRAIDESRGTKERFAGRCWMGTAYSLRTTSQRSAHITRTVPDRIYPATSTNWGKHPRRFVWHSSQPFGESDRCWGGDDSTRRSKQFPFGIWLTKRMSSNDIHHTAHFT